MPDLLKKHTYFDPEQGRTFVAADDGFYWKQGKKSPEDSKVTRLVTQYGWQLVHGDDLLLIFKRPRQRGELNVIRGTKRWYLDTGSPDILEDVPEGEGLASLQKALQSGALNQKAKAMSAGAGSTAVNNAGSGHEEVEGDPLFEHRVGSKPTCPHCGSGDYGLMPSDFETAKCNGCGKHWDHGIIKGINDPKQAGKLAMRPDYGSGYTWGANEACEQEKEDYLLELRGGTKRGSVETPAPLYVTGAEYDGLSLVKFTFGPDRARAASFPRLTARDLAGQIMGKFGTASRLVLAYDYRDMFKAVIDLCDKDGPYWHFDKFIAEQINWAKKVLKKQDRIIWFLRLVRLAIVQDMMGEAALNGEMNPKLSAAPAVAQPGSTVERTAPAAPKQVPAQPQQKGPSWGEKVRALYQQYGKELRAKGGNPGAEMGVLADIERHKRDLAHFYGLAAPEIENYHPVGESFVKLYDIFAGFEQTWKEQAKRAIRPKAEDKVWMSFGDGWAWWYLPRASCTDEAAAMGHCGNSPFSGQKGMAILSLRKAVKRGQEELQEPHLTFIMHQEPPGTDSGVLGEMKGKGNDKPAPQYHPYIVAMLKDPRIKGIAGGGYLATHNFAMSDLPEATQKEIDAANPGVGMEPQPYYEVHGMDDNLATRIKAILGLDSAKFIPNQGFAVKTWPDERAFLRSVGNQEMANAYDFVQTGKSDYDDPDIDDLVRLVTRMEDGPFHNLAQQLVFDHPKEMGEWYSGFDPKGDKDVLAGQVDMALRDLFTTRVEPAKKKQDDYAKGLSRKIDDIERNSSDDADAAEETAPLREKLNKVNERNAYEGSPVLEKVWSSWVSGGPDQDHVQEMMTEAMEEAVRGKHVEFRKDNDTGGWYQLMNDEDAVFTAQQHVSQEGDAGYYEPEEIDVSFPYNWDEYEDDRAVENLNYAFSETPKKPKTKAQPRLFTEPRSEAEAKRKGITVSKLLQRKA